MLQADILNIVFSTTMIYLFVVGGMRIFGKTEVSQLSLVDLVFLMLLGNAVQNAMVGSDTTLGGGLIAAITLFVMNWVMKKFNFHHPKVLSFIQGGPVVLIKDGKLIDKNIRKSLITENELMEIIRQHGFHSLTEVDLAILEEDGKISVLDKRTNN